MNLVYECGSLRIEALTQKRAALDLANDFLLARGSEHSGLETNVRI